MAQPCRVLILNERDPEHPRQGGAELHVHEIFSRLAGRGYEVTLACSSFAGGASSRTLDGVQIERLGRLPIYYPRVAASVRSRTRRGEFDVVAECLNKVPFYSPLYSRAPVLGVLHHLFGEVAFQQVSFPVAAVVWAAERFIPPLYRGVPFVAISDSSKRDLVARGIPADDVRVSVCGIEAPGIEPDLDKARGPVAAYLGRVEHYKRVDVFLEAMALLSDRFPEAEILVIGKGSAAPGLEELARKLGIAERTRFTGFVTNEERDALLARTRVCVCPSEKEGWGLTVIEANALGTPVVASDAPGLRDSVRDGETGDLVPTGDARAFAERIGALLADDALALERSRAAHAWSQRFDWELAADEMEAAIADARARQAGHASAP